MGQSWKIRKKGTSLPTNPLLRVPLETPLKPQIEASNGETKNF
jgi:hypothetical protein